MSQKLYIGNLPYHTTEDDVRSLLTRYEPIHSVILIADKKTGRPRGYGFVELEEPEAEVAARELDNRMYMGRNLRIGKATGRNPRQTLDTVCLCRCCMAASGGQPCRPLRH